jgi:hypothetical protein
MHGGRSTGPRTAGGLARLRAARTVHGRYNAGRRAFNRCILSIARRGRVYRAVLGCLDRLPPELAACFEQMEWELLASPSQAGSITAAQDRALQRAEAEALAPWKAAVALARQAARALPRETMDDRGAAQAGPHAPVPPIGDRAARGAVGASGNTATGQKPHPRDPAAGLKAAGAAASFASPSQARPHAPERPAAGGAALSATSPTVPVNPQARPHAPERPAVGGTAISAASPTVPANPQARPHAPERPLGGGPGIPAAPPLVPANPQPEPHAPERATPAAGPVRLALSGRNLRRWQRKQQHKQQQQAVRPRP